MPKICDSNGKQTIQAPVVQYDPFGAGTGGQQERSYLFNQMDQNRPAVQKATNDTVGALRAGAANPGWGQASGLASRTMSGDYLNTSPELEAMISRMRGAAGREAADSAANVQDQYTRNGMSFGTGNQQAAQSARALATAKANDSEAAMRGQNYANERMLQTQAPAMLKEATENPINYLSAISSAYTAPLAQQGQLVQGLAGNSQVMATPQDITDRLGIADMGLQAVGRL